MSDLVRYRSNRTFTTMCLRHKTITYVHSLNSEHYIGLYSVLSLSSKHTQPPRYARSVCLQKFMHLSSTLGKIVNAAKYRRKQLLKVKSKISYFFVYLYIMNGQPDVMLPVLRSYLCCLF